MWGLKWEGSYNSHFNELSCCPVIYRIPIFWELRLWHHRCSIARVSSGSWLELFFVSFLQNQHVDLRGSPFTVGHGRQCNLCLNDASISKVLCKLLPTEVNAFWLIVSHGICMYWFDQQPTKEHLNWIFRACWNANIIFFLTSARGFVYRQTRNYRWKRCCANKWQVSLQELLSTDSNCWWWIDFWFCWEECLCILQILFLSFFICYSTILFCSKYKFHIVVDKLMAHLVIDIKWWKW